jgi:hypothetical protein
VTESNTKRPFFENINHHFGYAAGMVCRRGHNAVATIKNLAVSTGILNERMQQRTVEKPASRDGVIKEVIMTWIKTAPPLAIGGVGGVLLYSEAAIGKVWAAVALKLAYPAVATAVALSIAIKPGFRAGFREAYGKPAPKG